MQSLDSYAVELSCSPSATFLSAFPTIRQPIISLLAKQVTSSQLRSPSRPSNGKPSGPASGPLIASLKKRGVLQTFSFRWRELQSLHFGGRCWLEFFKDTGYSHMGWRYWLSLQRYGFQSVLIYNASLLEIRENNLLKATSISITISNS